ncbi:MAG: tetratricopeptide repeat protein, partial [Balneolales bacterium]|nr:tetratricopeptide repeat protein [Balneolales bacterium]
LTESGQIDDAIFYLEYLAGKLDENQIYHEMLIIQYFNVMRSNALDEYGSINLNIIEDNIGHVQRHVLAAPESMLFTGNEYTDLASGHIDLQNELHEDYDPGLDSVVSILLEEARSLYTQLLDIYPDNEDAIYGMASTFMLVGNEGEANNWLELLD